MRAAIPKETWVHDFNTLLVVWLFGFGILILTCISFGDWYSHDMPLWVGLFFGSSFLLYVYIIYRLIPSSQEISDYVDFTEALAKLRKAAKDKEIQEALKNKQN